MSEPEAKLEPIDLERQIFAKNPIAWFETWGWIEGKEVGVLENNPEANWLQLQVGKAVAWCLKNKRKIQLILYKPRQQGCSTITIEILYVLGRCVKMKILVIGGQASQTDNLWKILRYYGDNDKFDWGNSWDLNETRAVCGNGTMWERETAGDPNAGRSGNYHAVIATEVARWPTDGAKNAGDVLNSVLNCVGNGEGTCVVMESTAQGPKGPFPKTWAGAVTLEAAQKGEVGNGYIKIFAPWYVFPRCWSEFTDGDTPAKLAERLKKAGDDKAIRLWKELKLQPEQVKWYHEILSAPECNGEPQKRDREHPTTEADGFSASSPSRFDLTALSEMDKYAASRANDIVYGNLTKQLHQPYRLCGFVPCDIKNASVAILEAPIPGESYLIATDNGRGESWTEGADTDPNAIIVWKRGRMSSRGEWQHGEVVAALCPENREDQPFLAEHCARLSGYYGNCMVVPESNKGELLIEKLREKCVPIWGRERKAQDTKDTETQLLGWETTPETKHYAIENLATYMMKRNHVGTGIRIGLQWIIDEMRTFVRHKNGTLGALKLAGCHDDFVMALAIAVACESSATFMAPLAGQAFRPEGMPGEESGHAGHW